LLRQQTRLLGLLLLFLRRQPGLFRLQTFHLFCARAASALAFSSAAA
jgi:hypothetical protein